MLPIGSVFIGAVYAASIAPGDPSKGGPRRKDQSRGVSVNKPPRRSPAAARYEQPAYVYQFCFVLRADSYTLMSMSEAALTGLKRSLRFRDLTLFYIVSGLSIRWIATAAAAGASTLLIWVFALVCFFVPLAGCVMELSSRYPDEGGLYVWTREAFGAFSGFLAAWTYWMSNLPYFAAVLYFGAGSALFAFGAHGQRLGGGNKYFFAFSLFWLTVITVTNILGTDAGKWLNNIGSFGSIIPISLLLLLGGISAVRFGSVTSFRPHELVRPFNVKNAIFWSP